jgi:multisubunit Na+/H+ antiporter MnhB subunit
MWEWKYSFNILTLCPGVIVITSMVIMMMFCRKRRLLMLRVLGMRLLTRLLLLVCSLSLVSLLFLSRCGLNVETEVQLDPGTGKYRVTMLVPT